MMKPTKMTKMKTFGTKAPYRCLFKPFFGAKQGMPIKTLLPLPLPPMSDAYMGGACSVGANSWVSLLKPTPTTNPYLNHSLTFDLFDIFIGH